METTPDSSGVNELDELSGELIPLLMETVGGWPVPLRLQLARELCKSVNESIEDMRREQSAVRGPTAGEFRALIHGGGHVAPSDETVGAWIAEHRVKKYGA